VSTIGSYAAPLRPLPRAITVLLAIARLLVGLLFIVSGLIKANDPLGFAYKLNEYFEVFEASWHLPFGWIIPYSPLLAIALVVAEMLLGFALLIGYKPKFTMWLLLLLILFFTFLTFYSAYFNKVTDCGCFGDALHLTPWQSFEKDIALMVLILFLFFYRNRLAPWMSERGQAASLSLAAVAFIAFPIYTYTTMPVVDFRPFKTGNNLWELSKIPAGAPTDSFAIVNYYQKGGEVREFALNSLPDEASGWKWKESKTTLVRKGYEPPIHDFTITTAAGDEYTEDFLTAPATLFVVAYKVQNARQKAFADMAEAVAWAKANKVRVALLTSSTAPEVAAYLKTNSLPADVYYTDATALKTVTRSNPGMLLLKNGTVLRHWQSRNMPTAEELQTQLATTEK